MAPPNPVVAFFASELRRARQAAGFTQEQLAAAISYSASLVAQVETCRKTPSRDFAQRCDDILKTDGLLTRVVTELLSKEVAPEWFRPWLVVEQEATHIRSFEPLLVPGLLQTEGYARVLSRSEEALSVRLERQRVLTSGNLTLVAILSEIVLTRRVGSAKVMYDQLMHLANPPAGVSVQILPVDTDTHLWVDGSFELATIDGREVVYVDTPARGFVLNDAQVLSDMRSRWDALRGEALPQRQSQQLIMEVAKQRWKS